LVVDKNLTLRGASSATTILQPAGSGQRVIMVTSGHNLRLENLTITGGSVPSSAGGGVYLENGGLELVSCVISNNSASYGGGVFQAGTSSSLIATDSQILGNTATIHGGGLYVEGNATLTNTTLAGNTAGNHGGGMHVNQGNVHLVGGIVSGNHATDGNGGGVNLNNGLDVNGTQFIDNTAGDSGGGLTQWNSGQSVSISNASFNGNSAKNKGGGAYINLNYLSINNTTFVANSVDTGGADNAYGGGLYAGGGLDGTALTFMANSAHCTGCSFSVGGGLLITRSENGPSSISQSTFESNQAWIGGGISSDSKIQLTLTTSTFRNNGHATRCGYGGAVGASEVNGDQLLFQGNVALNAGGALRATSITLTRSSFLSNSVTGSGGGGGVFAYDDFTGVNLAFISNTAANGAALRVKYGPATLWHATIAQPAQTSGPAIYIESAGTLELKNSILTNYNPGIYLAGTLNEDYNMFYNNYADIVYEPGSTLNQGTHSTGTLNPQFISPAGGDYHLLASSPAINMGANLGVTIDREGLPRTNRWDVGAYQFYWRQYAPMIQK
jgi:predicted outer membrane repeat protein